MNKIYNKIQYLIRKNRLYFIVYILDYLSYLKRIFTIKKIDKCLLENQEGLLDYNIPSEWFYEKKLKGVSGVARLKNAEHFLEKCMESYLSSLDELILVDNLSNDKTYEICKNLKMKYPDKIKIYQYPFKVSAPSNKNMEIPANSVHSLAYYYNWSFSKTKYSHVVKVDDDMLMLNKKWEYIREKSLTKNKNRYNIYRGLNIAKDNKGKYCTLKGQEGAGWYGDHGIYKVSPYAYYIQGNYCEVFQHNYWIKRHGFSFLHLKLLKQNYGLHNLKDIKYKKDREQTYLKSTYDYNFYKFIKREKYVNKDFSSKINSLLA